jgi:hypothetical protein
MANEQTAKIGALLPLPYFVSIVELDKTFDCLSLEGCNCIQCRVRSERTEVVTFDGFRLVFAIYDKGMGCQMAKLSTGA